MKWDLYGMIDQSEKESENIGLTEDLARMKEEKMQKLRSLGFDTETFEMQPRPAETDEEAYNRVIQEEEAEEEAKKPKYGEMAKNIIMQGSDADFAPREVKGDIWSNETGGFDIVKNIAQGWYFDIPENILSETTSGLEKLSGPTDRLMFNLPFLKNYDPARDYLFTMSGREFKELKREKKVSYMPNMIDEQTTVGEFTRNMTKVIRGLHIGHAGTTKMLAHPVFRSVGPRAKATLEYTTPGLVANHLAFKPYEERISNMISETVVDSPLEMTKPFFDWLAADEDNEWWEERYKMSLEGYIADLLFVPVFRLMKGRKEILKAELEGRNVDEIVMIEEQAQSRMLAKAVAREELPMSSKKIKPTKSAAQKVLDAKLEDPTIFSSPATAKKMAEALVKGDWKDFNPSGYKVFNTEYIENEGAAEALNMFEALIRNEMKRRVPGLDVAKGPKTLEEINRAGLKLAETIQGNRIVNVVTDTASQLGVDKDTLMTLMMKDLNDLAGLEARTLAYRGVIAQMGSELQALRLEILNNPGDLILEAKFLNMVSQTEDALRVFGEVRRIPARTVTAQRLKIPDVRGNNKQFQEQTQDLIQAMKETGMDSKKIALMAETLGVTVSKGPLMTVRVAQEGIETLAERGWRGLLEFYRGMLLASLKSHVTNTVSGTIETLLVPSARIIGGTVMRDRQVVKEVLGHYMGLIHGFRPALGKMMESIIHERNILDPLGTKVDGLVSPHGHAIAMEPLERGGLWHPYNWAAMFVNAFGKVSRGSLRLLGGEDEFFKQWNYRAQAYSKIVSKMPNNMSSDARNIYISRQMDTFFDDMGRATDMELRQYARKITFTEELMANSTAAKLHVLAKDHPWAQFFIPFIRTPTNIMVRLGERTPGTAKFMKTSQEMLNSGDPNLRAQVIGNQAIGMAMYATAVGYIMEGSVTGSGPVDPDRNRLWKAAGNVPYSVRVPFTDRWFSYNRLDPTFMPMVFLTSAFENGYKYHEDKDDYADMVMMGVIGFIRAVTDRTYLQGLKQMFNFFQAATSGNLDRVGLAGTQMVANVIPPIIQQQYEIGQHFGFYDGAEGFQEAVKWQEKFLRRATQATGYNAVKHNWITGEPIVSPTGYNTGIPVFKNNINPYIEEIVRMGRSIDPPDTKIGNTELNGPQYAELNRLIGTIENGQGMNLLDSLEAFMSSPDYDLDPNRRYNETYEDWRVKGVRDIMRAYKEAGRNTLLQQDPILMEKYIEDKMNAQSVMSGGSQLFDLNQR